MKQRLMRPTAALFPAVGIAGILWGNAESAMELYGCYYMLLCLSLNAVEGFRIAAAREPGVRRVDRRFSGAFLPILIGAAVLCLLLVFLLPKSGKGDPGAWGCASIAATLVTIEHLFEERMYALGRRLDGVILSCIANGLLLLGLLLGRGNQGFVLLAACGVGAAISIVTSYAVEPMHGFSLKPANIREGVANFSHTATYLILALSVNFFAKKLGYEGEALLPFLYGLIPWRLAATTARRTEDESRPLNLLLISFAALTAAVAAWLPGLLPCAVAAALALFCGAGVYCAPTWRLWTGVALTILALLPLPIPVLNAILAVAAIILNLKNAFRRRV